MYHWTTWWEETGNRKKITKGGTLRSNHSRNAYKVSGGNRIKAEGKDTFGGRCLFLCIKGKDIHWICFIAGKYSVWYNHGSLKEVFKFKGIKVSEWKMYILPK